MIIKVRIQDVEVIFDDKRNDPKNNLLAYEHEGLRILESVKSITDDCIRAYNATKPN